ncbi:bis-aminopropyl spermidine synthase family protein [bacterium]|nr:bis-aminopropyl spermidine synthase family protein [bacterium]
MNGEFAITTHLDLLPSQRTTHESPKEEPILAINLLTGRRLRAPREALLQLLERHRLGASLRGDLAERAVHADILRPVEESQALLSPCDLLAELDRVLSRYLAQPRHLSPESILDKLDRCRQDFARRVAVPGIEDRLLHPQQPFHKVYDEESHYLWHDPQRLIETVFATVSLFVQREWTDATYPFDIEFLRLAIGRPRALLEYEQQPCLLSTTLERCRLARRDGGTGYLVLGDDDLISVALTCGPNSQARPDDVDVIELDERLLQFLAGRTLATLHSGDLTAGLPAKFHHRYTTVFTDPMYLAEGMHGFIGCCRQGLSFDRGSRVFLSTCPEQLQHPAQFWQSLAAHGLQVSRQHKAFSRYRLPQSPRQATLEGLTQIGLPAAVTSTLLSVPYLYADMFELESVVA